MLENLILNSKKPIDQDELFYLTECLYKYNLTQKEVEYIQLYINKTGLGPQEISENLDKYAEMKKIQNKFLKTYEA